MVLELISSLEAFTPTELKNKWRCRVLALLNQCEFPSNLPHKLQIYDLRTCAKRKRNT
jgi:hypothetical protein